MSIDIEILTGDVAWPVVRPLYDAIWPQNAIEALPWGHLVFAHADLRVLLEAGDGLACHVGIYRRHALWNGQKMRVGGIGSVMTRADSRRLGYASLALTAAIHTLKEERATDFAMLFCEPKHVNFYAARKWKPFEGDIVADQPAGSIRFDALMPMVFDLKRAPRQGAIDLCGLPW